MRRIIKNVLSFAIFITLFAAPACPVFAETKNIYRWVLEDKVEVTVDYLNIRTGAGLRYPTIGSVTKGEVLDVLGALGNWYVVCTSDESIGVISKDCVKIYSLKSFGEGDSNVETEFDYHEKSEDDVLLFFELINDTRLENALEAYTWDERLNMIARIKAKDMSENNYFGHYSELYGTPFAMLKQFDVPYRSATESIIGNISAANAFVNIMTDPVYRGNILNMKYEKIGIGTAESDIYGKIFVLIFIG